MRSFQLKNITFKELTSCFRTFWFSDIVSGVRVTSQSFLRLTKEIMWRELTP
uniref:Uncharacterized protein n=1 Tax=Solanum lycopersicum TaxID=4081 RepID=A0A3Q7HI79_SOLLC